MKDSSNEGGALPLAPDHRRDAAEAWQRASEASQRLAVTMMQRVLATETRDDALNLLLAHDMIAYEQAQHQAIRDAQASMHCALLEERHPHPYVALASDEPAAQPPPSSPKENP